MQKGSHGWQVEIISMAVHRNILRLRGFCITPGERLLVYPYMPNGSVASRLGGTIISISIYFKNKSDLEHSLEITDVFQGRVFSWKLYLFF